MIFTVEELRNTDFLDMIVSSIVNLAKLPVDSHSVEVAPREGVDTERISYVTYEHEERGYTFTIDDTQRISSKFLVKTPITTITGTNIHLVHSELTIMRGGKVIYREGQEAPDIEALIDIHAIYERRLVEVYGPRVLEPLPPGTDPLKDWLS